MTAHIIPHPSALSSPRLVSSGAVAAPPSAAPEHLSEYGIKQTYTKLVPNRTALTSSPINEATSHRPVSLPFVSILKEVR